MAGTIKIAAPKPPPTTVTANLDDLRPGDTIEIGVSSEFSVKGDHNWATVKISGTVGPSEPAVAAFARIEQQVLSYLKQTVLDTVELTQGMGS